LNNAESARVVQGCFCCFPPSSFSRELTFYDLGHLTENEKKELLERNSAVTAQFATSIRPMPNFQHTQIKETLTTHPKKDGNLMMLAILEGGNSQC
jgi:hypothetical protein